MQIPETALRDPLLTKDDLVLYAVVLDRQKATIDEVAEAANNMPAAEFWLSLKRLTNGGYIRRVADEISLPVSSRMRIMRARADDHAGDSGSESDSSLFSDNNKKVNKLGRITVVDCLEAFTRDQASGDWTITGLLGLFHTLYKHEYHIEYKHRDGRAMELAHIKVVVDTVGFVMAEWCIRALFSAEMEWVKNKRLDFFSPQRVQDFVIGIANELRKKTGSKPEHRPETVKKTGTLFKPKR